MAHESYQCSPKGGCSQVLRKMLDAVSLQSVVIVASDADFKPIADDVVTDAELSAAVGILG